MRVRCYLTAFMPAMISLSASAQACMMPAKLVLDDVKFADVVVIGRISNYQIILDQRARDDRKKWLARDRAMPAGLRKFLESQKGFLSDYALFNVLVDQVLWGKAPKSLTVTWDNSTFPEPASLAPGEYLLALRNPDSIVPPLRGPSATILANPEPKPLTLLQTPCAPAFIFLNESEQAGELRRILRSR